MATKKSKGGGGLKSRVARSPVSRQSESYVHKEAQSPMRPEVGTQAQFRKKKEPARYRYDSSLAPDLNWDGQNPAREQGEVLIAKILAAKTVEEAKSAAAALKSLSKPFLNWTGKAERLSFDVPTLPLFVHERLSTRAIIETLKSRKADKQMDFIDDFFADPKHPVADQVLRAYEYKDDWVNRMILGDSLVVMNSLLHYESLGGQVQMIYMDPPYGVKFGSNFQPFVRKRDVAHNNDDDFTREPEMVQAYRDTWELGLHSYLTYLRDRLLLSRELLRDSGSIFLQISDENLHHVREVMDEVFGEKNFSSIIAIRKTGGATSETVPTVVDYILWYAKSREHLKYCPLFVQKVLGEEGATEYTNVELPDGKVRQIDEAELSGREALPTGAKVFATDSVVSEGFRANTSVPFEWNGIKFDPGKTKNWKTSIEGMLRLCELGRILPRQGFRIYKRYFSDFPYRALTNVWMDVRGALDRIYAVQTDKNVVQRCILMTTDPGDLVLDPTCGSGTTAHVAEQWGRRWITIDTSRVPLSLARQRLLTATFPYFKLKDDARGPIGGFVYAARKNSHGEEVGGIVPHVTLGSIANNEPAAQEVLVDRPEVAANITRVCGPFVFEATIPTPVDWEGDGQEGFGAVTVESHGSFIDRMLEILRRSPVLRLEGNKTVQFKQIRPPARTLSLSAEAVVVNGADKPVAIVFGPESAAVSEKLVYEAAKEASAKNYTHLYVIGFAIQPNARVLIEKCMEVMGIAATYVQATPDLLMGDLLKNMRSSQIFSVCGLPEVELRRMAAKSKSKKPVPPPSSKKEAQEGEYEVELLGLDVFDPVTMDVQHRRGDDVPAWFLDTDYNGLVFRVCQAFFPRTSAWDNLKKALKADYEEGVWDHLAGTVSAPFAVGEHKQIAVKVIDDRGNELLVIKTFKEAT